MAKEYDYEVKQLSDQFYQDYPKAKFPELLTKTGRPYTCLLIDTHEDYLICIPFRSNIPHKNAYLFKGTARSEQSRSGLDYTKLALIKDEKYISNTPAVVDNDEYTEMVTHIKSIVEEVCLYIETYRQYISGHPTISREKFARQYQFSTIGYFADILEVSDHS